MKDNKFKIESGFGGANIPRTIRFTEKLFERLNSITIEKNISLNLLVLQCCQYALDNLDDDNEA